MTQKKQRLAGLLFTVLLVVLTSATDGKKGKFSLAFEKYQLPNGLTVVLHQDKSDPMVAVAIQYHVGSNREVKGRTGFAHLFEHMMFARSENVGQGQFMKLVQNAGGTLNGGTGNDGTVYYEVVPKNGLETMLWLESDRMGYLSNTVTQKAFAVQQNVVQNEKRQSMDNRPYGFTDYLIDKNLYPENHPYNWQVIGEMQDLQNATVEDVKQFHDKYYVPNNATLVIAGDFEPAQAKALVEKYFGEIPKGAPVEDPKPMNVTLSQTKRFYHEDNFAKAPELTMVWPTIEQYSKDSYALDFLGQILSDGKKAPLYKVLVEQKKLTSRTSAYNGSQELTGKFAVTITANEGVNLNEVEKGIFEAFAKFEKDGISDKDLERLKAQTETQFYQGISSVLGKSFQLARYNEYAGDPSFIEKDLRNSLAVTKEDIMNVYKKYIKDKPYILTSFVPKGQKELAADNSQPSGIVEEDITKAHQVNLTNISGNDSIVKTPTRFDRSKPPLPGPDPVINLPEIWQSKAANGMKLMGIEQHELPLVQFSISLKGGQMLDDMNKVGEANLVAEMLMAGTRNRTPEDLEEAIDLLGSSISIRAGKESVDISVRTLKRNLQPTMDLLQEILLQPRWDEKEFGIARSKVLNGLLQRKADPNYLASLAFNQILYGKDNIFYTPVTGNETTVNAITLNDLKAYYNRAFSPTVASFNIAGDLTRQEAEQAVKNLAAAWKAKQVNIPQFKNPASPEKSTIYFVDLPGAKQSVINIGYLALARNNPNFYPATVMNYKLGGSAVGQLFLILREAKGFTYGAYSRFSGTNLPGPFLAYSSVRSNTTHESVQLFKDIMTQYRDGISTEDFDFTRNAILKSNARSFETLGALLGVLQNISNYNLPTDFIKQDENVVRNMTPGELKQLAIKYIVPEKMIYVIVGDAATQMEPLKSIGFGAPVLYKPL